MGTRVQSGRNNGLRWHWLALGILAALLAAIAPGCGGGGGDGDSGGRGAAVDETPVTDTPGTDTPGADTPDTDTPATDAPDTGTDVTPGPALSDVEMRLQFIQSTGNGFILPTYGEMVDAAADLIDDADAFCVNPNRGNLTAAQARWRTVSGLWVESELVKFGPQVRNLVHDDIDVPRGRHADASGMESRIRSGGVIDASRLPTTQRGLEGIEYLLFGDRDADADILADYTAAMGSTRCQFLEAVVDDLRTNIEKFYDSWRPGGDDYLDAWNTAGESGNTAYPFVQEAVKDLMGEMEFVLDDLVNVKIAGYKAGARRPWVDGEPESWRSGNSLANIRHRIEAAEMIYLGTDRRTNENGFGIDDYLRRTGESALDDRIQDQFDAVLGPDGVISTLEDQGVTLGAAVDSHPTLLEDVEQGARTLLRTLKRDLTVTQLDVFFAGFNDQDGD